MRLSPKTLDNLLTALAGLRDDMGVEIESDLGVSPKTVAELRRLTALPPSLVVTVPQGRDLYPESVVTIGKLADERRD